MVLAAYEIEACDASLHWAGAQRSLSSMDAERRAIKGFIVTRRSGDTLVNITHIPKEINAHRLRIRTSPNLKIRTIALK